MANTWERKAWACLGLRLQIDVRDKCLEAEVKSSEENRFED